MAKTNPGETSAPRPHSLTLNDRKILHLTGVSDVTSFDEKMLVMHTDEGQITISGTGLHVSALLLEEGRVSVEGQVDAIQYAGKGRSARKGWRSLFS